MTYHDKALGLASAVALAIGATFVLPSGPAEAATINVIDFSDNKSTDNRAHEFAPRYGAHTPDGATWDEDPTWVVPPSSEDGISLSPYQNTPLQNTRNYFSVIFSGSTDGGDPGKDKNDTGGALSPVVLSFDTPQNYFKLLWGSIDDYNEITFSDASGSSVTVTGTDVADAQTGLSDDGGMVALVEIFDFMDPDSGAFSFTTAEFISDGTNSFEFATPVPLPASALLLLGGLGGLGGLSALRRRKRTA